MACDNAKDGKVYPERMVGEGAIYATREQNVKEALWEKHAQLLSQANAIKSLIDSLPDNVNNNSQIAKLIRAWIS